jgi:hypothetical protein
MCVCVVYMCVCVCVKDLCVKHTHTEGHNPQQTRAAPLTFVSPLSRYAARAAATSGFSPGRPVMIIWIAASNSERSSVAPTLRGVGGDKGFVCVWVHVHVHVWKNERRECVCMTHMYVCVSMERGEEKSKRSPWVW